MPPTFAYAMILFAYICAAGALLVLAALLAIPGRTRMLARRLAGGTIGSFPGVFICQVLSIPVIAALWSIAWGITHVAPNPTGVVASAVGIGMAVLILVCFATASLGGFIVGWSLGSSLASGVPLADAVRQSPLLTRVFLFRR